MQVVRSASEDAAQWPLEPADARDRLALRWTTIPVQRVRLPGLQEIHYAETLYFTAWRGHSTSQYPVSFLIIIADIEV